MPAVLFLILASFSLLYSATVTPAIFTEVPYTGLSFHTEGFSEIARASVKVEGRSLQMLSCHFRVDRDSRELEFLVCWDDHIKKQVGKLKGTYIDFIDLKKLFHVAKVDPESKSGTGLLDDIYANKFSFRGIEFTFGSDNDNALEMLKNKIEKADIACYRK